MAKAEATLVILGNPVVKKNGMQIIRFGQRPSLQPNRKYRQATSSAIGQLRLQWGERPVLDGPLHIKFTFWRTRARLDADLSNLYEAPQDWLKQACVIVDDKLIQSHDGSRKHCLCDTCDERPIITRGPNKGRRKHTCGKTKLCNKGKTEIVIMAYHEDTKKFSPQRTRRKNEG